MSIRVEPNKAVTFTNPAIVSFMTRYAEEHAVLEACEDIIISYCRMANSLITSQAQQHVTDTDTIVSILQSMDAGQKELMLGLEGRLRDSISQGLVHAGNDVADRITCQVARLISAVHGAASQLDAQAITAQITAVLAKHVDASHEELQRAKDNLVSSLFEPVRATHSEVLAS
jgi:hypothetical protein